MFFSVAEPVTQYMMPPEGQGQTMEAARQAMVWTLFHYGLTGWSMYALMGIALGYFSYRSACRSPFAPPFMAFYAGTPDFSGRRNYPRLSSFIPSARS